MNKKLNISDVRVRTENESLRAEIEELKSIIRNLIKALQRDLTDIDIDNFSNKGINDIKEMITEVEV